MRLAAVLAITMLAACTSTTGAPAPSTSATPPATASSEPTAAASGGAINPPSPTPPQINSPTVSCRTGASPTAMVMTGGYFGHLIYDVTDPVHPRLVCTIRATSAHLFTGDTFAYLKPVSQTDTDVILHSIGSGNESKVASFPVNVTDPGLNAVSDEAWTPDGSILAYTVADPSRYTVRVWLYSQGRSREVHDYGQGIGDCVCRFGLPPQVLAFSPDGEYLVDGWAAGKGATPLTVIRVADGALVYTADISDSNAVWSRTGHQLFLIGNGVQSWTPESGAQGMLGNAWSFLPGLSPDGSAAAYTAYSDPATQLQPRVYTYDLKSQRASLVVDKMRTQILFVKDGWVWYLEETACASTDQCPGSTEPTGNVLAMQLATGVEQPVSFAPAENPTALSGAMGSWLGVFAPGEFWPST